MILGLDFYDTITKHPQTYRDLAYAVLADGGEVYIISAIKKGSKTPPIQKYAIPNTATIIVEFNTIKETPRLKYEACLNNGVQLFIDDMQPTIDYLNSKKILCLKTY